MTGIRRPPMSLQLSMPKSIFLQHHAVHYPQIIFLVAKVQFLSRYDPQRSVVELSPVRLYIHLVFPAENDNTFTLDLELKGVVEVEASKVSMMGTKLEVKMKKAESSSWAKLNIPREVVKKEEKYSSKNHKLRCLGKFKKKTHINKWSMTSKILQKITRTRLNRVLYLCKRLGKIKNSKNQHDLEKGYS